MIKIMQKLKNNTIFGIIIGGLIFGGIVYAASYYAKDVTYNPSDETWNVNNVEEALNSLYSMETNNKKMILLGSGTSFDLTSYDGYERFTSDDFIVEIVSASETKAAADGGGSPDGCNPYYGKASGFSINKVYDPSSGILTITGALQKITTNYKGNGATYVSAGTQNLNINVWLIK